MKNLIINPKCISQKMLKEYTPIHFPKSKNYVAPKIITRQIMSRFEPGCFAPMEPNYTKIQKEI